MTNYYNQAVVFDNLDETVGSPRKKGGTKTPYEERAEQAYEKMTSVLVLVIAGHRCCWCWCWC
jgi:hypothetical protein